MGKLAYLVAAAALAVPQVAMADIWCGGVANEIVVTDGGTLVVSYGYGYLNLCSVKTNYSMPNGAYMSKEGCQLVMNMAVTSQLTGKVMMSLHEGTSSCSNLSISNGWPAYRAVGYRIVK